jgi:hypothetical protein
MLVWLLGVSCAATQVRADDWLVSLSDLRAAPRGVPTLRLSYPDSGLPALVAAGDVLAARLQLPAALTPPPGVQQARALAGFAAELIGEGVALAGSSEHRYPLPVIALRPEAGSSLEYRMRLVIPAYAAPGSYDLLVRTPFGERRALRSVRVLAAGATPRVGACPPPSASGAELGSLPLDVWLCSAAQAVEQPDAALQGLGAQPRLSVSGERALALRVGRELWVHSASGQDGASDAGFERELRSVLAIEPLARVAFSEQPPPSSARSFATPCPLRSQRGAASLLLDNRTCASERVVPLLLPAKRQWRSEHGQLELYPATGLTLREVHTLVGLLHVHASATATLALTDEPARASRFSLAPLRARSGIETRVRVRDLPTGARVAFEYGSASSAWPGPELRVRFAGPVEQPLRVLVLPPNGAAELLRARVSVEPQRPPSCAVGLVGPRHASTRPCILVLFALGILLKRRPRWAFGNRLRPFFRFEQLMVFRIPRIPRNSPRLAGPLAAACLALCACEPTLIPNTHVEDTSDNREVIDFVEKYRQAIETRNTIALLALASTNYFDDLGTPSGTDDIDYDGLKAALVRMREEVLGARYQISYRAVTFDTEQRVLVDMLYTGWFRVNGHDGPEWKRRLEPHRIVIAREDGRYRILSGM